MVDSERYVLACYRYIELNPVRAGMVLDVADYRWSSFACNGLGRADPLIRPHPAYSRVAPSEEERLIRYRALVSQGIGDDELASIRLYAQRQRALGSPRFQQEIEAILGRRAGLGKPGRPSKRSDIPYMLDSAAV